MVDLLIRILSESWSVLGEMAPYLLFGFLFAGVLSVVLSPELVERHLGGKGLSPVFKAALFGVPLPLCSCGVIPVAAGLRRHGATRGATTSFLLSTPQTGVDSILVTFSLLGWVFAVFRPLVALVTGVLGGTAVTLLEPDGSGSSGTKHVCHDACCAPGQTNRGKLVHIFRYAFVTLPQDIGKALLIGLLMVGVISTFVPDDFFAGVFGTGFVSMLAMMALGVPIYVCATASVPIAAALIAKGISPGAALVFLMTGPATNAATIAIIWKIMGGRTAITYLGSVIVAALGSGMLLNFIFDTSGMVARPEMAAMMPQTVKTVCAVLLLAILVAALIRPQHKMEQGAEPDGDGPEIRMNVTGMTCNHCVETVRRALMENPNVRSVDVNLKTGSVTVRGDDIDTESLGKTVAGLGYTVEGIGAADV